MRFGRRVTPAAELLLEEAVGSRPVSGCRQKSGAGTGWEQCRLLETRSGGGWGGDADRAVML
jgi:hypothetical protein